MKRLTGSATVFLGIGLVFLGGAKLNGVTEALAPLQAIGISPDLFRLVGGGEIAVGLLLTQSALHRIGAAVLGLWMLGAVGAHLWAADPAGAVVPLVLSVFGLFVSYRAAPPSRPWPGPAPLAQLPPPGLGQLPFVGQQVGLSFLIRWAVGGVAFWASLPLVALSHARNIGASDARERLEYVLLYLLFFGYGAGGVWNFVGHFFMSDRVAASVGWPSGSPFQQELAFYALGTGVVGLLTPWLRDRFWVAAALVTSIFGYGAAYTHAQDYLLSGNDAPMNWSFAAVGANVLIPTVVLVLTWAYARRGGFGTPARTDGVIGQAV